MATTYIKRFGQAQPRAARQDVRPVPSDGTCWRKIFVKCSRRQYYNMITALRGQSVRAVSEAEIYKLLEKEKG